MYKTAVISLLLAHASLLCIAQIQCEVNHVQGCFTDFTQDGIRALPVGPIALTGLTQVGTGVNVHVVCCKRESYLLVFTSTLSRTAPVLIFVPTSRKPVHPSATD